MDAVRGRGRGRGIRGIRIRGFRGRGKMFRGMHPKKIAEILREKEALARRENAAKYSRSHRRSYSRSPRRSRSRSRSRSRRRSISPRYRSRRYSRSRSRSRSRSPYYRHSRSRKSPSWDCRSRSRMSSPQSNRSPRGDSAKRVTPVTKTSPSEPCQKTEVKKEPELPDIPKDSVQPSQWKTDISLQHKDYASSPLITKTISLYDETDLEPKREVSIREEKISENKGLLHRDLSPVNRQQVRLKQLKQDEFDIFADDQPKKSTFSGYSAEPIETKTAKTTFSIPALDFDNIEDEEKFLYGDGEDTTRPTTSYRRSKSPCKVEREEEHVRHASGWSDDETDFITHSASHPLFRAGRTPSPPERELRKVESSKKDYSLDDLRHLLDREEITLRDRNAGRDSTVGRSSSLGSSHEREGIKLREKSKHETWESPEKILEKKHTGSRSPVNFPSRKETVSKFLPSPQSPFSRKITSEKSMWSPLREEHMKPHSPMDHYRRGDLPSSRSYDLKSSISPDTQPGSAPSHFRYSEESRGPWHERSIPRQAEQVSPVRSYSPGRRRSSSPSSSHRYASPYRGRSPHTWLSPGSRSSDYRMRRSTSPPPRKYRPGSSSPSRDYIDRQRTSPDRPIKTLKRRSPNRSWSPGSNYSNSPLRHSDRDSYRRKHSATPEDYRPRERSPGRYSPRRSSSPPSARWRPRDSPLMREKTEPSRSYQTNSVSYYLSQDKQDPLIASQPSALTLLTPDATTPTMPPTYPYTGYTYDTSVPPPPNFGNIPYPPPFPSYSMPPPVSYASIPTSQVLTQALPSKERANLKVIPLQAAEKPKKQQKMSAVITLSSPSHELELQKPTPQPTVMKSPMPMHSQLSEKKEKMTSDKLSSKPLGLTEFLKIRNKQKSELRALEEELLRVNKMQGELMRKKQREKDGHRDPMILENAKLQDDIKKQISDIAAQMEETKKSFFSSQSSVSVPAHLENKYDEEEEEEKVEEKKPEPEKDDIYETASVWFDYFDPGNHWCKSCNEFLPNIFKLFEHLHTDEHKQKMDPTVRPWKKLTRQKIPAKPLHSHSCPAPIKGAQFLEPMSGFFCSLCEVFLGDIVDAEEHLKSPAHNRSYTKYSLLNPFYERRWNLDRSAGLAAVEKLERKKRKEEEREREYKRRKREEESKKMRKELLALEQEHSKPVKELDEDNNTSHHKSAAASGSSQHDSSKLKGIKLTLLGEKKKGEGEGDKGKDTKQTQIVYIGKAPCFKSVKQEKTKQPGFGKFSWKKKEDKEDSEEKKGETGEAPPETEEEWMTMFIGDKTSGNSRGESSQSFPLRKCTTKAKTEAETATPNEQKKVTAKDIATAFAGKLKNDDLMGNKSPADPKGTAVEDTSSPKICSNTYIEAVKKAESMKIVNSDQTTYKEGTTSGDQVRSHSGPLLPDPVPLTGPLLQPPQTTAPIIPDASASQASAFAPQTPAYPTIPPPNIQPQFQGFPQHGFQGFPQMPPQQQQFQGYHPSPYPGYPQMQQPYQDFGNYQQGFGADYSQYQQYPNYPQQPFPQQQYQGYAGPMGPQQPYGPPGAQYSGPFYPQEHQQGAMDGNRHQKQPLLKNPKLPPTKKTLRPINTTQTSFIQSKLDSQTKITDSSQSNTQSSTPSDKGGGESAKGKDKDNAKAEHDDSPESGQNKMTEEEKDLKLLGIDKADLTPLATPRVPHSVKLAASSRPSSSSTPSQEPDVSCSVVDMELDDNEEKAEEALKEGIGSLQQAKDLQEHSQIHPVLQETDISMSSSNDQTLLTSESVSNKESQQATIPSSIEKHPIENASNGSTTENVTNNPEKRDGTDVTPTESHIFKEAEACLSALRDAFSNETSGKVEASATETKDVGQLRNEESMEALNLQVSGHVRETCEEMVPVDASNPMLYTLTKEASSNKSDGQPVSESGEQAVDLRMEMGDDCAGDDDSKPKSRAIGNMVMGGAEKNDDGLYHIPPGSGRGGQDPALDLTTDIPMENNITHIIGTCIPENSPRASDKRSFDGSDDRVFEKNDYDTSEIKTRNHEQFGDIDDVPMESVTSKNDMHLSERHAPNKDGNPDEANDFTDAIRGLQMLEAAVLPHGEAFQFNKDLQANEQSNETKECSQDPDTSMVHSSEQEMCSQATPVEQSDSGLAQDMDEAVE